jgi:hypothetical protein
MGKKGGVEKYSSDPHPTLPKWENFFFYRVSSALGVDEMHFLYIVYGGGELAYRGAMRFPPWPPTPPPLV